MKKPTWKAELTLFACFDSPVLIRAELNAEDNLTHSLNSHRNATGCVESFKWEFLQFLKLIRENGVDGGEKGYKSVWRGGWNLTTTFIPNNGGSDCILCIPRWLLATSKDGWGRGRCPFSQSQLIPIHIGVVIVSYVIRNLLLSMLPPLCFLSHLSESFSFISLSNFTSFSQLLISFYRIIRFLFSF